MKKNPKSYFDFSYCKLPELAGCFTSFKKLLLEIGFIKEMRTTGGNKEMPKPFSTIPFIHENRFYPFTKIAKCRVTNGTELYRLNPFSRIRELWKKVKAPLYYLK